MAAFKVLEQVFLRACFVWRVTFQTSGGQNHGPNFRNGGCFFS